MSFCPSQLNFLCCRNTITLKDAVRTCFKLDRLFAFVCFVLFCFVLCLFVFVSCVCVFYTNIIRMSTAVGKSPALTFDISFRLSVSFHIFPSWTINVFFCCLLKKLPVLILYERLFVFTSGASAFLGRPRYRSDSRNLRYSRHLSEFMSISFTRKRTKHENSQSAIFVWYKNGHQRRAKH